MVCWYLMAEVESRGTRRSSMRVLHSLIAILFTFYGLYLLTSTNARTAGLVSLMISNISLAAISIEHALDRSPVELSGDDRES